MIVVTGASGRIGRAVQFIVKTEHHSDCFFATRHLNKPLAGWVEWAPSEKSDLLLNQDISAVLHLAGVTPSTGTPYTRSEFIAANCDLVLQTLEIARAKGIGRVIIASSASVYGSAATDGPIAETTPVSAQNDYGQSKVEMERRVAAWCYNNPHGPEINIVRIGNIAGADQLLQNARLSTADAPLLLDQFASGRGPQRSYVGPVTLARILLSLARSQSVVPDYLNLAQEPAMYMENLLSALNVHHPVHWQFRRAGSNSIENVIMNVDLLMQTVDHQIPAGSAIQMIAEMLQLENWIQTEC